MNHDGHGLTGRAATAAAGSAGGWLLPAAGTALAAGLIYLGFLSSHYNLDGTVFALWLREALYVGDTGKLWHPQHLLYLPMGYAFSKALAAAGVKLTSIAMLQLLDTLSAGLTLLLFYKMTYDLTRDRVAAVVGAALLGFSFAFWYFAVEPEVDGPHAFFLLLGFFALVRLTGSGTGSWPARAAVLGAAGGLVTSSNAAGGLFLLPLGWGALWYLNRPDAPLAQRFRAGIPPALLFTAVALGSALVVYSHGYTANPLARDMGFLDWVRGKWNPATGLGYEKNYWALWPLRPRDWAYGLYSAFLAGPPYRYDDPGWLAPVRAAVAAGVAGAMALYALRLPRLFREDGRVHAFLLLFIIPHAAFTLVWDPRYFELKSALLPFLWLAASLGLADARRTLTPAWSRVAAAAAIALAAGLFAHNFISSIRPGSDPARNPDLTRARFVENNTPPDAVIYIAGVGSGYNIGKIYLPYFAVRRTRVVDFLLARSERPFPAPLAQSLAADQGHLVFVLSELVEPGPALDGLAARKVKPEEVAGFFKSLGLEKTAAMPDGFALYRVTFRR
ncbi:MAG TPA: hypothetical protein VM658_12140 [bacterium]|nr:hypothetical protein [bacterium]